MFSNINGSITAIFRKCTKCTVFNSSKCVRCVWTFWLTFCGPTQISILFQLALTSFFENEENPVDEVAMVDDDSELGAASLPPFGGSAESSVPQKAAKEKKSKTKSTGSRIVTLHNMSSSSDEEENSGQASYYKCRKFYLTLNSNSHKL